MNPPPIMSLSTLPVALKKHNQWLVSDKKIPLIPGTRKAIKGARERDTMTFKQAHQLLIDGTHSQAGILHSKKSWLLSVDGDHCIIDSVPIPELAPFIDKIKAMGGYIEISTSGNGFRIPTSISTSTDLDWSKIVIEVTDRTDKNRPKVELYNAGQYVIYTGNEHHPGDVLAFDAVMEILEQLYPQKPPAPAVPPSPLYSPLATDDDGKKLEEALWFISADCNRDQWLRVGMALHHYYQGGSQGLGLFHQWSATGSKYCATGDSPARVWRSFGKKEGTTVATLYKMAKEAGWKDKTIRTPLTAQAVMDTAPPVGSKEPPGYAVSTTENTPKDRPDPAVSPPVSIISGRQLESLKAPEFIIDGIIPENSYGQIYGDSGCFKTFVALTLALAIGSNQPWMGHAVKKGWALYLCGEGFWGMKQRMQGWQKKYGEGEPDHIFFSQWIPDMKEPAVLNQLSLWCKEQCRLLNEPLQLVVIDTFARGLEGNENSAEDVGNFIKSIDLFKSNFNCSILQIHHTGHEKKERGRGSSALYAAFDYEYRIEKLLEDSPKFNLINTKTKDFKPPPSILLKADYSGESLVVVKLNEDEQETYKKELDDRLKDEMKTNQQRQGMALFSDIYADHKATAKGHERVTARVNIEDFANLLVRKNITRTAQSAKRRVVEQLVSKGLLVQEGEYLRPNTDHKVG